MTVILLSSVRILYILPMQSNQQHWYASKFYGLGCFQCSFFSIFGKTIKKLKRFFQNFPSTLAATRGSAIYYLYFNVALVRILSKQFFATLLYIVCCSIEKRVTIKSMSIASIERNAHKTRSSSRRLWNSCKWFVFSLLSLLHLWSVHLNYALFFTMIFYFTSQTNFCVYPTQHQLMFNFNIIGMCMCLFQCQYQVGE